MCVCHKFKKRLIIFKWFYLLYLSCPLYIAGDNETHLTQWKLGKYNLVDGVENEIDIKWSLFNLVSKILHQYSINFMLDLQSFLPIRQWPWFVLQVTLILLLCACIICSSHLEELLQQSKFTVSCQIHFLQESPLLSWPTVAHFGLPFSFFSLYMDVKMTSLWCLLWSIDSRFWGYGKGP